MRQNIGVQSQRNLLLGCLGLGATWGALELRENMFWQHFPSRTRPGQDFICQFGSVVFIKLDLVPFHLRNHFRTSFSRARRKLIARMSLSRIV